MTTMTVRVPPAPATLAGRIRWALADGLTVVRRDLRHLKYQPGELVGALMFPAIMVLLFGYVFGSAISVPGGNYREYLMPGLFAMSAFTGVIATTIIVAGDAAKGVMDRFRSMPMARLAVPFGQTGADIITGSVALVIMVGCGLAVGWRPHGGAGGMLAAAGLLILMRFAVSWAGVFIGLSVRNEETADQLVPLIFPVTMISNTFVPTAHMPAWLRTISDWNPVSALVAACRHLLGSVPAPGGAGAWPLAHPVLATLLWVAVLLAVFVPLSVRWFATANR
ncbi:MAG TPA: ABC transporter permease [Streptosporangiaceae bacterium]|jgi:ABC-2 type transport system permease protein|nr:ABC transporter permease [Streptosporangiaceae bacterium]